MFNGTSALAQIQDESTEDSRRYAMESSIEFNEDYGDFEVNVRVYADNEMGWRWLTDGETAKTRQKAEAAAENMIARYVTDYSPAPTFSPVLVQKPETIVCPSIRVQFYLGDFSQLSESGRNAVCLELMAQLEAPLLVRNALQADARQAFQALPRLERLKADNVAANIQGIWRQSGYNEAVIDAALVGLSVKPFAQQMLAFRVGVR